MRPLVAALAAGIALMSPRGWFRAVARLLACALVGRLLASRGALISRIAAGSPAETAGLRIGDVVIRFAGHKITSSAQLRSFVAAAKAGIEARIDVLRDGRRRSFRVRIGEADRRDV